MAPYHGRETASGDLEGGVEQRATAMPPGCLAPGESWKDQIAVGSPKNLLPRADPGPVGTGSPSRLSSGV